MRGLMLRRLQGKTYRLLVGGVLLELFRTPKGVQASAHAFVYYSSLTRTAGGLRLLRQLEQLPLRRKHFQSLQPTFFGYGHQPKTAYSGRTAGVQYRYPLCGVGVIESIR